MVDNKISLLTKLLQALKGIICKEFYFFCVLQSKSESMLTELIV